MKIVFLIVYVLLRQGVAFSQNYFIINNPNENDTAYVDTVIMPVYLLATYEYGLPNDRGIVIPKYIIPLDRINEQFTVGDYLNEHERNGMSPRYDSMLFLINFRHPKNPMKPYYQKVTDESALSKLNSFLNHFKLMDEIKEPDERFLLSPDTYINPYSIYIYDAEWIRVRISSSYEGIYDISGIQPDKSLKYVELYFLKDIRTISKVIRLKNQDLHQIGKWEMK